MVIKGMSSPAKSWIIGITGASGSVYALSLIRNLLTHDIGLNIIFSNSTWKLLYHELKIDLNFKEKPQKKLEKIFNLIVKEKIPFINPLPGKIQNRKNLQNKLKIFLDDQISAPIASGSCSSQGMVVVPCSINSLAKINAGISDSLLTRASEVTMKEGRKLILVPRETPLSENALINMLSLKQKGAHILPAMPAFYDNPKDISDLVDFVTGKILNLMQIPQKNLREWNPGKN